jgi:hypothetical protein
MLNVLSLGAGVQSSTMALMAARGEITPMPDCAIFADTQSEPGAVYRYLDWLETQLPFPVHRVTAGSLREEILKATRGEQRMDGRPPFFTGPHERTVTDYRLPDGRVLSKDDLEDLLEREEISEEETDSMIAFDRTEWVPSGGMLRRQCTQDFKLLPIHRKQRELIGLRPRQRGPKDVRMILWIGISIDEATRMKPSPYGWISHRWPLIEMEASRRQCAEWLRRHNYPVPSKSACTFCPYHDKATWADMKRDDPGAFSDAVEIDAAIRHGVKDRASGKPLSTAKWYLHRSLQPLDQIDFAAKKGDKRQLNMFENECEGMCGV